MRMDPYENYPYPVHNKPPGTYRVSSNAYITPPNLAQPQLGHHQESTYYQGPESPYVVSPYNDPAQNGYGFNEAGNDFRSDLPSYGGDPSRGRNHRRNPSRDLRHRSHSDHHHQSKPVIVISDADSDDNRSNIGYEVRKIKRPRSHHCATSYSPDYQSTRSHHHSSGKRATSHDRYDHVPGYSRHRHSEDHSSSQGHKSHKPAHHPDRYQKDSFHRENIPLAEMKDELEKFKNGPATHQDYQDVVKLWNSGSKESAWRLIQSIQAHPDARHEKLGAKGSKKHRHRSR